jgi:hypothetical protein
MAPILEQEIDIPIVVARANGWLTLSSTIGLKPQGICIYICICIGTKIN